METEKEDKLSQEDMGKSNKDTLNTISVYSTITLVIVTSVLIIATVYSIIATNKITEVSSLIEIQGQRDYLISQIDYTSKVIEELKWNKEVIIGLNNSLDNLLINNEDYIGSITTTRLDTAAELITGLDEGLIFDLNRYSYAFILIKNGLQYFRTCGSTINITECRIDATKRTKQNIKVLLEGGKSENSRIYGLSDLIDKFEKHKQKLELELKNLNCNGIKIPKTKGANCSINNK